MQQDIFPFLYKELSVFLGIFHTKNFQYDLD